MDTGGTDALSDWGNALCWTEIRTPFADACCGAEELGECISTRGWVLPTGGRPAGVMAAASRGATRVDGHLVVGMLPDEGSREERQSSAELDQEFIGELHTTLEGVQ